MFAAFPGWKTNPIISTQARPARMTAMPDRSGAG